MAIHLSVQPRWIEKEVTMNRFRSVLCTGQLRIGLLGLLISVMVLAGCGPTANRGQAPTQPAAPAATQGPAATQPSASAATPTGAAAAATTATVQMVQKANFGRYLVDSQGKTLYSYAKDTPNTSN